MSFSFSLKAQNIIEKYDSVSVSGRGKTKEDAKYYAIIFASTKRNSTIISDGDGNVSKTAIIKADIIKDYEIISESILPDGSIQVVLKVSFFKELYSVETFVVGESENEDKVLNVPMKFSNYQEALMYAKHAINQK